MNICLLKGLAPLQKNKTNIVKTACDRCGTCCKKGGPSFHHDDKALIEKGIILSKFLYTIRKGEPSYDNIKGCLVPAASDIIKLKGKKDSLTCIFLDENENRCKMYDNRPQECRVLKCWDTREIERIYCRSRLIRKDLIANVKGLWELIEDHQTRCSYGQLKRFLDMLNGEERDAALNGILSIINYDSRIRDLAVQKGGLDSEMTDFLFGRPMTETIRMYNFKIQQDGNKYRLVPTRQTKFPWA